MHSRMVRIFGVISFKLGKKPSRTPLSKPSPNSMLRCKRKIADCCHLFNGTSRVCFSTRGVGYSPLYLQFINSTYIFRMSIVSSCFNMFHHRKYTDLFPIVLLQGETPKQSNYFAEIICGQNLQFQGFDSIMQSACVEVWPFHGIRYEDS